MDLQNAALEGRRKLEGANGYSVDSYGSLFPLVGATFSGGIRVGSEHITRK